MGRIHVRGSWLAIVAGALLLAHFVPVAQCTQEESVAAAGGVSIQPSGPKAGPFAQGGPCAGPTGKAWRTAARPYPRLTLASLPQGVVGVRSVPDAVLVRDREQGGSRCMMGWCMGTRGQAPAAAPAAAAKQQQRGSSSSAALCGWQWVALEPAAHVVLWGQRFAVAHPAAHGAHAKLLHSAPRCNLLHPVHVPTPGPRTSPRHQRRSVPRAMAAAPRSALPCR